MSIFECPSYHFQVDWGGTRTDFTEVSGLNITIDVISHREGSNLLESSLKIPGMISYSNIIFKRPIRNNDNEFFEWIITKKLGTVERRKVRNSFPVKYSGPVLEANTSEIAMEILEIAHEGLMVETV